jgi:cytochrome P450
LIKDLFDNPDDFVMAIERYSCSVVSIIGWGRRIGKNDDPIVERALAVMHQAAQIFVPGDYWMETLPVLQKMPAWMYSLPTRLREGRVAMAGYWYALTREGAETSTETCFSKVLFKDGSDILSKEEIGGLTSALIGGGVDTTTSTMLSFILACIAFPDAIKPARDEIDKVVVDRVPDWDDETKLPYCKAMIKEVLRWRSVAILGGLPHAPIKDDSYRGYHIPAGTSIMVSQPRMILMAGKHMGNSPTPS